MKALVFGMALGCVLLGLAIAWLQAENYALADRLQSIERENLDLEFTNRELDAELMWRMRAIERGDDDLPAERDDAPAAEGLQ